DNILRQITYANSSDTPPASAQIDWTFDDGDSGDLTDSLEGYYSFDTGTADDDSSGTPQDGTLNGNAAIITDGTRGEVLILDGDGDSVSINSVFGGPADITLAAWVNIDASTINHEVISLDGVVGLRADDNFRDGLNAFFWDGSSYHSTNLPETRIEGSGWHHVAFTFDDANNTQTLYLDGVALITNSYTTSIDYTA
ncbi:MAG: LamG domain-containing protein, partial [bacterium]|nr:LamG domain-containing protein [bacterium]